MDWIDIKAEKPDPKKYDQIITHWSGSGEPFRVMFSRGYNNSVYMNCVLTHWMPLVNPKELPT